MKVATHRAIPIALLIVTAGCRTTAPVTVQTPGPAIRYEQGWMTRHVEVLNAKAVPQNGLLIAQATLLNTAQEAVFSSIWRVITFNLVGQRRHDIAVEYRFRWLDKDGMELPSQTSTWRSEIIRAHTTINIQALATSPDAVGCVIDVRPSISESDGV